MALDFSAASAALKQDYQPAIREQINNQIMLLNQVETNTSDVEGEEAHLSLHTGRNSGVGARPEGGSLPTAGSQAYTTARVPVKFNYGRIQVTGPIIEGMKSNRGSFTRAIDSESKGIVADLKRDVNRQCYTPSDGTIARVTSGTSTTVFVVGTETEARRLEVGMVVDIYSSAFASQDTGATISAVNVATKTITVSSALGGTPSAGDIVVRAGVVPSAVSSKATEDAQYEIHGLEDIVADGTSTAGTGAIATPWLHGIDGSATTIWQSYDKTVSAAPTDSVFEEAMDEVNLESGEDINLIVTSHKAARAYAATLKSQKRFTNKVDLQGGFSAITVQTGRGEVPLWAERDCLDDVAYLLNTSHLTHWVMSDWSFMDRDGAVLSRVASSDAYEATLYKYHELGTDRRNAHGVLSSLTV